MLSSTEAITIGPSNRPRLSCDQTWLGRPISQRWRRWPARRTASHPASPRRRQKADLRFGLPGGANWAGIGLHNSYYANQIGPQGPLFLPSRLSGPFAPQIASGAALAQRWGIKRTRTPPFLWRAVTPQQEPSVRKNLLESRHYTRWAGQAQRTPYITNVLRTKIG